MKYTIAIFDLDGTILNTLEDLADSTNYALKPAVIRNGPWMKYDSLWKWNPKIDGAGSPGRNSCGRN